MREGLHSGLDGVDWEHEGVLQDPCNSSGKHVLQGIAYIISTSIDIRGCRSTCKPQRLSESSTKTEQHWMHEEASAAYIAEV